MTPVKHIARYAAVALLVMLAAGCATKKKIVEKEKEGEIPLAIVDHSALLSEIESSAYSEASAERKVDMTLGGKSVGGVMRMVDGQRIWLNISVLGITFARAMFTPDSLMYYERLNKTAFEGRWKELQNLSPVLGAVDYAMIEDLLCGRPVFRLSEENFVDMPEGEFYVFSQREPRSGVDMNVQVNKKTLRVVSQGLVSPDGKVGLTAEYVYAGGGAFPSSALFSFPGADGKALRLDFSPSRKMQQDFPFTVPKGYKDARELLRALGVNI